MNALDIFFVLFLIWGIWNGFKKGLIIELFTFLALFLGLYAGIHFSDFIGDQISGDVDSSYATVIAFTVTFLAVGAMVYFGGKAIEKVIKIVQLSLLNKLLGAVFGLLKSIFILGALIMIFDSYDDRNDFIDDSTKEGSLFYYPAKNILTFCIPAFEESSLYIKQVLREDEVLTDNND